MQLEPNFYNFTVETLEIFPDKGFVKISMWWITAKLPVFFSNFVNL